MARSHNCELRTRHLPFMYAKLLHHRGDARTWLTLSRGTNANGGAQFGTVGCVGSTRKQRDKHERQTNCVRSVLRIKQSRWQRMPLCTPPTETTFAVSIKGRFCQRKKLLFNGRKHTHHSETRCQAQHHQRLRGWVEICFYISVMNDCIRLAGFSWTGGSASWRNYFGHAQVMNLALQRGGSFMAMPALIDVQSLVYNKIF